MTILHFIHRDEFSSYLPNSGATIAHLVWKAGEEKQCEARTSAIDINDKVLGICSTVGTVRTFPCENGHLAFVGTGDASACDLIGGIGALTRTIKNVEELIIVLPSRLSKNSCKTSNDTLGVDEAAALGALLGAYRFNKYTEKPAAPAKITIVGSCENGFNRGKLLAEHMCTIRDLVNEAPNHLNPTTFVERVCSDSDGLEVEVFDVARLSELGCGGILGVGQGSACPPAIVRVSHIPANAKARIGIIGKGITFDTGGLSLKISGSMLNMKSDMTGAATTWQTVKAAHALDLPVRVDGWLAIAENMPGSKAQRVDDVVTMANGKTVEVKNTDAEGRLVMADALALAAKTDVDALIDIATLTGAQIMALGMRHAAIMGTDAMRERTYAAAQKAAEDAWPMPLPCYLEEALKSPVADLQNIGEKFAGMLTAGLFLKNFVGDHEWAHIDIAGPSFVTGAEYAEVSKGGTGYGLRTLISVIESYAL